MTAVLLFTDLDGTLLDHDTYLPGPAAAAVRRLQGAGVTVVPCSAKTRAEQEPLRRRLGLGGPIVVENGAAVHLPAGWPREGGGPLTEAVSFGTAYADVRRGLCDAAHRARVGVRGYGDMSAEEVAALTGLDVESAERARRRQHSETFVVEDGTEGAEEALASELAAEGLRMVRGTRFWTAMGHHDKGRAVGWLAETASALGPVSTFAIGDYENDREMMAAVETPMLVERPEGGWASMDLPGLVRLEGAGPAGWARGADLVMERLEG